MNARINPSQLSPETLRARESEVPLHQAQSLTAGGVQAHIALNGQTYTLRITRAGKLILTK